MTPAQYIALVFVGEARGDPTTGRARAVDLRHVSEPTRQRIIDLGMMEPPLVDVEGDRVFLTPDGFAELVRHRGLAEALNPFPGVFFAPQDGG